MIKINDKEREKKKKRKKIYFEDISKKILKSFKDNEEKFRIKNYKNSYNNSKSFNEYRESIIKK